MITSQKRIDQCKEFQQFEQEFDYLIRFFEKFSELIFLNGRIISFISGEGVHTLNTALIDSSAQTLKSIKLCCSIGSFSDANTLIRKLRDDLIQYVYILNVINLRQPFVEEDVKNIKLDADDFVESLLNVRFNVNLAHDEQAVLAWLRNKVADLPVSIKRKLEFENYMRVLRQSSNVDQILTEYNLQGYWDTLRKKLNDYVHSNGVHFSMQNNLTADNRYLEVHFKNVNFRASYISSFFLTLLLMIDSSLVASTDYVDHLDCGAIPPEDSQYFVATFIQHFIDTKVSYLHPELKQFLKDNNSHSMKIE